MKLALIGGGGVRSPLFVYSALKRAKTLGVQEISLMDTNAEKLAIFGSISQIIAEMAGGSVKISTTTNARQALEGARYVVTTIRVGEEQGRVLDERIALKHGVLGQETTGPGGFAMAMRSIPAILDYAQLMEKLSPGAWMFNFTNPAGLVTQALHSQGFTRVVGICDGANSAQHAIAHHLDINPNELRPEVFGLNHLSWTRKVLHNGENILPRLLSDGSFIRDSMQKIFEPALRRQVGMWLNEYLYYYYYAEKAVQQIASEEMTRGEEILMLNKRLLEVLRELDPHKDPQKALQHYIKYNYRRGATYMYYAQEGAPNPEKADELFEVKTIEPDPSEGEGYAGVALDIIQGFEVGGPVYTALNVPNQGAIACMQPDDIVEVSCRIDRRETPGSGYIHPLLIGEIPDAIQALMRAVKSYERMAAQAILTRSRKTAVAALMTHPLVVSYSRATALVDDYLKAHAAYIGPWDG